MKFKKGDLIKFGQTMDCLDMIFSEATPSIGIITKVIDQPEYCEIEVFVDGQHVYVPIMVEHPDIEIIESRQDIEIIGENQC